MFLQKWPKYLRADLCHSKFFHSAAQMWQTATAHCSSCDKTEANLSSLGHKCAEFLDCSRWLISGLQKQVIVGRGGKWSACHPNTLTIRVLIPLRMTVTHILGTTSASWCWRTSCRWPWWLRPIRPSGESCGASKPSVRPRKSKRRASNRKEG